MITTQPENSPDPTDPPRGRLAGALKGGCEESQLLGKQIAGYVTEHVLGSGAQACVFRAHQISLHRSVALKVLLPAASGDRTLVEQFLREARCIAGISHQNVVHVHEVGEEEGVYFLAMEEVHGQSLKQILDEQGRVPPEMAVNLVKQCVCGLERVARSGVVHRDIKPANLIIDDRGLLVISDFGLAAQQETANGRGGGAIAGTPIYMPPEQAKGEPLETASDQYALGATFYHLLTGEVPFFARNRLELLRLHQEQSPPDPCRALPQLPAELGRIVQRMMAKSPSQRYSTWRELFRALEDFELRHGYIEGRSAFLSEGLINLAHRSAQRIAWKIASGVFAGVGLTVVAAVLGEWLKGYGYSDLLEQLGSAGAVLLALAFALIMYIAGVRKGILPQFGSLRSWLQVHIGTALLGYVLSMSHSANYLQFFSGADWRSIPGGGRAPDLVPIIPFLNAVLFTAVVSSGFVGRYLWRDLATQALAESIERGAARNPRENNELTLAVFAHRSLRYWRLVHYPLAFALLALTLVHVFSVKYFGG